MKKTVNFKGSILFLLLAFASYLPAQEIEKPFVHIPDTISKEAAAFFRTIPDPHTIPPFPAPEDIEGWKVLQQMVEEDGIARSKPFLDRLEPTVTEIKLEGVPALDVKPRNWQENKNVLVYTHGGAYVLFSARSTLGISALIADATGLRVIAVDYTLAPYVQWPQVIDQVIAVFEGLKKEGYAMKDIAICGDSAGGGMAAGAVLKMRDQGKDMPAAVVLWSPWSDITETGDTYQTLKHAEPHYLYDRHLRPAAHAYAAPKDQKHPYVSPVYSDYSKGFPPTLIQGGTKEILLSNFIRHYQALDVAGQTVKLDLYEGMNHVFQATIPNSPESETALSKMDRFLKQHLGK
jgi:acetyl esterase/lipase